MSDKNSIIDVLWGDSDQDVRENAIGTEFVNKLMGICTESPEAKLEKAENSKNPTTRNQAVLAETFKKMRKK